MKKTLLAAAFFLFCTLASFAQNQPQWQPPSGGGAGSPGTVGGTSSAAAPASQIYTSPNCPVANTGNCYFGYWNTQVVTNATVNNTSQTVTCPSNNCNFVASNVGMTIFGYNTSGSIVLPEGTITSINNAQSVQVSNAATITTTATTILAWGNPDVTTAGTGNLVTAWNANTAGLCGTLVLPKGITMVEGAAFQSSCTNVFFAPNAAPAPVVYGDPARASVIIPTPNFVWTTCGTFCFSPGVSGYVFHYNWALEGLGYTGSGYTTGSKQIISGWMFNWTGDSWCVSCSTVNGYYISSGQQNAFGIDVNNLGNVSCYDGATGNTVPVDMNAYCYSTNGAGLVIAAGAYLRSHGSVFGSTNAAGAVSVAGTWSSNMDSTTPGAAVAGCAVTSTGTAYLNQTACVTTTSYALANNGGKVFINGATLANTGGNTAGCFSNCATAGEGIFDQGGLVVTGTRGYSLSTMPWYNEQNSGNQVQATAAKLVLSTNWGTGAADSAILGGNFPVTFTITNGSASTGAAPTVTYTFPTPLPVSPIACTMVQTGGTNAIGTYAASALSSTGVTFTYSLTPTASDTEFNTLSCTTY